MIHLNNLYLLLGLLLSPTLLADSGPSYIKNLNIETTRKNNKKWTPRDTVTLTKDINKIYQKDQVSQYGSWLKNQKKATGFFRVEKDDNGRWWFIDPEGFLHINVSVNSVTTNKSKKATKEMLERFGSSQNWANETTTLLRNYSFNSLGSWTDSATMRTSKNPLPHTLTTNFMAGYSKRAGKSVMGSGHRDYENDLLPVFDPEFETYCHEAAKKLAKYQNDPYVIGVFSDNELPFSFETLDRTLKLAKEGHGYKAAIHWLKEQNINRKNIDEKVNHQFLQFAIERYFRICKEAIASQLPNHLYLGCRFHGKTLRTEPAFRAAAKYVDVISINWYGKWTPEQEKMDEWMSWANRPFIITEFYAKGVDSGLPNTSGAGWLVKTQKERGYFYQNFAYALSQHPGNIGWHWFKYIDNDPNNAKTDASNRDANKGIVDAYYKPYTQLLDAMKILNSRVYQIRTSSK